MRWRLTSEHEELAGASPPRPFTSSKPSAATEGAASVSTSSKVGSKATRQSASLQAGASAQHQHKASPIWIKRLISTPNLDQAVANKQRSNA